MTEQSIAIFGFFIALAIIVLLVEILRHRASGSKNETNIFGIRGGMGKGLTAFAMIISLAGLYFLEKTMDLNLFRSFKVLLAALIGIFVGKLYERIKR